MNYVDKITAPQRFAFLNIAKPLTYEQPSGPNGPTVAASLMIHLRGLVEDDLFGAVMQQDMFAQVLWADFAAAFPTRPRPQRYDRIRTSTTTYAVEAWKPAPGTDPPIFWKLHLRGSTQ